MKNLKVFLVVALVFLSLLCALNLATFGLLFFGITWKVGWRDDIHVSTSAAAISILFSVVGIAMVARIVHKHDFGDNEKGSD